MSMLDLITRTEDENEALHKLTRLRNKLYDVLCSMNKALRAEGYRGVATSRQIRTSATADMCEVSNFAERYRRNFELFRLLKSFSGNMLIKLYSRIYC